MTKILSEHFSEDGKRHAIIKLVDEHFDVDFYLNNDYYTTITYESKALTYVEDAAENWVLGIFSENHIKDFDVVRD